MNAGDVLQLVVYLAVLLPLAWALGLYMERVFSGKQTFFDRLARPLERLFYRAARIDAAREMGWREYVLTLLIFSGVGIFVVFLLQMLQGVLPFNSEGLPAPSWHLALNTAVSFVSNTNWQSYAGEGTLSYLSQAAALTVQNFVSAAAGIAVAIALIRGLAGRSDRGVGNFWSDLTRAILWVLLPLSLVLALALVSQGVIQNLGSYQTVTTLEGAQQTIAMGPVASQEAIKELGTNGGGFFGANSAHPYENPTPLSNFLELLAMLIIPTALTFTYGRMVGNPRQGYVILGAMLLLFLVALAVAYGSESYGNPQLEALGVAGPTAMEGKEVRFGIAGSSLWAVVTTATSCGAVNSLHDSFTPLGGMMPLLQIVLGEVVFGGVGSGLYGMLIFVMLTVFIVGLMVGRTPEYLGKKIEPWEMKMVTLAILIPSAAILTGSALALFWPGARESLGNGGPHGLSEMLYAFASASGNNGSAFAGLNTNTPFFNLALAMAMLIGRFGVMIPVLAIAGSMGRKRVLSAGAGTFETTGLLFMGLLVGVVLIIGLLTFFPALALGPIIEQLLLPEGINF